MNISQNKVILASKSPRRKELLKYIVDTFDIQVSETEELINPLLSSEEVVMELALEKAEAIAKLNYGSIVLGFDTLVILDDKPIGKPADYEDAFMMLQSLSNKSHKVITGCAIIHGDYIDTFSDEAIVTFNMMSDDEIHEYLATKEPFDKAGAYGIQGFGARYIKSVKGDYYSVMGMPLQKLYNKLRRL